MKKIIATIQARMNSLRFPGKVMKKVKGRYILDYVVERAKYSNCDDVMVCTTKRASDDLIEDYCRENNISIFRGSEHDVLHRFFEALKNEPNTTSVRITADNPLVDPNVINYLIDIHKKHNNSATTNYFSKTFPNGTIVSLTNFEVLEYMAREYHDKPTREHIILGFDMLPDRFVVEDVVAPKEWNRPDIRFCIDYEEDLELFEKISNEFDITGKKPTTIDIIDFLDKNENIKNVNYHLAKKGY